MEDNKQKQANDAAQNYLREVYASYEHESDTIKILEDLRNGQDWNDEWFTPKEFDYLYTEEEVDTLETVFCFHEQIIFDLNQKMLDWWKSQYEAGNIDEKFYKEELFNIIDKDFDVWLDTQEKIELFISGLHPEYPAGSHFRKYFLVIRKQE